MDDITSQDDDNALSRRYRQIEALSDSFQRIAANLSTDAVLESTMEAMRRLEQTECGAVWDTDPETGRWTCASAFGVSRDYQRAVEALYEDEETRARMLGPILRGNQAVVMEDVRKTPMDEGLRRALIQEGVHRLLAVPMRTGDDIVGSLAFYGRAAGPFHEMDVRTARLLADQSAVALQNARNYERARDAAAETETLNRISGILTQTSSREEVLHAITHAIAPLMGVSRVAVHVVDEASFTSTLVAYTGLDPEKIGRWGQDQPLQHSSDHPILGELLRTGEPLTVDMGDERVLASLDAERREVAAAFHLRSLLVAPMFDAGRLIGTITFDEPGEDRHWRPRDLRVAQGLAAQAAVAMRNARLADEARAVREWLEDKVQERTEELRAAHAEVMAAEKLAAVGFMAREVAHGLRNPLNVISTSLYYLKTRFPEPDEKVTRHFDAIARSVEQAANTITQMMNLAGSRTPEMAPVDLNHLTQRAIEERHAAGSFRWMAEWDTSLPLVRGDWTQLSHAVKALVGYVAGGGGIIHVRTSRAGNKVILAVGDDRPPLSEEEKGDLFQPFSTSATEWTGLSLTVARQIALKHHGDLCIAESDGLTWVCLELPVAEG